MPNANEDFREQIPTAAYYNMLVLQQATIDGDLRRALKHWSAEMGVSSEVSLINPGLVASLLYCLIVVPKEVWDPPSNDAIYVKLNEGEPLKLFHVTTWQRKSNEHPLRDFLRHLRNAIAHANFSVDSEWRFEFWDKPSKGEDVNFRASIVRDDLARFLSVVGSELARLKDRKMCR